jgi:anti-sigma B factor antagonist
MKIETRNVNDVLVVDMAGRLDSLSSGQAGDRIVEIVRGADRQILLNFEKIEYLSSAGLQITLRGAKLLRGNRGVLKICCPTEGVRQVLEISGFNSLLQVYGTESEAVSAFSRMK